MSALIRIVRCGIMLKAVHVLCGMGHAGIASKDTPAAYAQGSEAHCIQDKQSNKLGLHCRVQDSTPLNDAESSA